jgi:RHS repeat-associated protein
MTTHSSKSILLATDLQNSVLNAVDANRAHGLAYTPYGHRPLKGLLSLLGFNGELMDPLTGHYHLGNGYRTFNLLLMRFNNPDNLSPFGEGDLNAYAYCAGDPINRRDPSGHSFLALLSFFKPSSSLTKTTTASQKALTTAGELANMKRGMIYKGKVLGYQLGERSLNLKLDKKPLKKIENYTRIINEKNELLTDRIGTLLNAIPDPVKRQNARSKAYTTFVYPTVDNLSTSRDKAVYHLHNQVMNFENNKNIINYLQEFVRDPAVRNSNLRELT